MKNILLLIKKHWLVLLVVFLALFLRLFRIDAYMTFLGDEGRDALVWLRMLHGKFTLIGPMTSIGNMYLGPLFYYLMFPFYLILGTVGPSIGTALFAGGTIFLLWYCGREWFSEKTGLVAAFLYAISPVAIVLSRSAWNPNVMPFFALLSIWGIWQFWRKERYVWLTVCGVLISFAVQSHYLGLLLIPIVILFWIVTLIRLLRTKDEKLKNFLLSSVLCALCFVLLTILPLVWFDLRHNFINYQSFYKFFSERQTTVNLKPYKAIPEMWPLWQTLVTRLVIGKNTIFGFWFAPIFAIISLFNLTPLFRCNGVDKKKSFILLLVWVVIGLLGMGLYKQHIYDHYFGFLFPAVFLIAGVVWEGLWNFKKGGKIIAVVGLVAMIITSFKDFPLKYVPGYQMQRTAEVDKKIIEEAAGKPFNLGMIAKQNYDAGYRYFLEKWGKKAMEIDPQAAKETIAEQLFVVCEIKDCQPTTHPQAEIANFGWSEIEKEWTFSWGVKLFKLVHYKP